MTPIDTKSPLEVRIRRFTRPNPDNHMAILPQGTIIPGYSVMKVRTTDATPTLLSDILSELAYMPLADNTTAAIVVRLIASQVGGSAGTVGDSFGSFNSVVLKRLADGTTTALVDFVTETASFADAGAAAWVTAITANVVAAEGGLEITATGEANKSIDWEAQVFVELNMAIAL